MGCAGRDDVSESGMAVRFCKQCGNEFQQPYEFCPKDGAPLLSVRSDDEHPAQDADPLLGRVVDDRYRVLARIGRGGMGAVYRALQIATQREVALKVIRADLPAAATLRFMREARATSALCSLHTVTTYDFGQTDDGMPYLVLELLDGCGLDKLLRSEGHLHWQRAVRIIAQAAVSLEEAHSKGIIHRDLKPANIFLADFGPHEEFVKVLDFGVAKLHASSVDWEVTRTGTVLGTPAYMSPEQARGDDLDGRSDLYALGVILYEMLAGRPPFHADKPLTILMKHCQELPPSIRQCVQGANLPAALVSLVDHLLAKRPDDRVDSAERLRAAALRLLGGRSDSMATPAPETGEEVTAPFARGPSKAKAPAGGGSSFPVPRGARPLTGDKRPSAGLAVPDPESVEYAQTLSVSRLSPAAEDNDDARPTVPSDPALITEGLTLPPERDAPPRVTPRPPFLPATSQRSEGPTERIGSDAPSLRPPQQEGDTLPAEGELPLSLPVSEPIQLPSAGHRRTLVAAAAIGLGLIAALGFALLDPLSEGGDAARGRPTQGDVVAADRPATSRGLDARRSQKAPDAEPGPAAPLPPGHTGAAARASNDPAAAVHADAPAPGASAALADAAVPPMRGGGRPAMQASPVETGSSAATKADGPEGSAPGSSLAASAPSPTRPQRATLWLRSRPSGAQVVDADGRRLGRTPLELPAPKEAVSVRLSREGYLPGKQRLSAGAAGELVVRLKPRPRPRPRTRSSSITAPADGAPAEAGQRAGTAKPTKGQELLEELMD